MLTALLTATAAALAVLIRKCAGPPAVIFEFGDCDPPAKQHAH